MCVCIHAVIQIYCIAFIQIEKGNIFFLFLVINSTFLLLIKIAASLIFQSSVNTSHHICVLENSTWGSSTPPLPFKSFFLGPTGTTRATGSYWTPGTPRTHWDPRRERDERWQWPSWSSRWQRWQGKPLLKWNSFNHSPALLYQIFFFV